MNDDTQAFEPELTFAQKYLRFFRMPRLYVTLMESKDKKKAIFMRGFYKGPGEFAMARFEVEEKENVEDYWHDNIGLWELIKNFFKGLIS